MILFSDTLACIYVGLHCFMYISIRMCFIFLSIAMLVILTLAHVITLFQSRCLDYYSTVRDISLCCAAVLFGLLFLSYLHTRPAPCSLSW